MRRSLATRRVFAARCSGLLTGLAMATTLLAGYAVADDTEVFFGQVDRVDRVRPNVLFVIDTSGSMDYGRDDSAPRNGEPSRLDMLKVAMDDVLRTTSDVNVGLMRMNGFGENAGGGGAVIYPITPIDKNLCDDAACGEIDVQSEVSGQSDNAEEDIETFNNRVYTNGHILSLGHQMLGIGPRQVVGMRFPDLAIPQGARILSAHVDFQAKRTLNLPTALTFKIEDDSDVDAYEHLELRGVSARSTRNDVVPVNWSPGRWSMDELYASPDLSTLVQGAVDDTDWCGGNALGLIVEGSGNRDAYTFRSADENDKSPPTLRVKYTMDGTSGASGCQTFTTATKILSGFDDVSERSSPYTYKSLEHLDIPFYRSRGRTRSVVTGLRFDSVDVPKDADILDARIKLTHARNRRNDPISLQIRVEQSDDADSYRTGNVSDVSRRDYSSAEPWDNVPPGDPGESTQTPDLSGIVEAVVSRSGWSAGNAMAFRLDGKPAESDYHSFNSFENSAADAPLLSITYRANIRDTSGTVLARDEMRAIVSSIEAEGGTPVADSLLEATNYYLGKPVLYGKDRGYDRWKGKNHENHRVSHPGSYTGGELYRPAGCTEDEPGSVDCKREEIRGNPVYKSALTQSCQASSIVLLTDGEPSGPENNSAIRSLIGSACTGPGGDGGNGHCTADLVRYLAQNDLKPSVPSEQKIRTHTVSFNLGNKDANDRVLRSIADAGDGETFRADDTESLVKAFRTILSSVESIDTSFTAPGATVNQYNRLTHREDIYFALFRPDDQPRWDGNLKKYRVGPEKDAEGNAVEGSAVEIRGVDGVPVVDPASGFFSKTAKSYWTPQDNASETTGAVDGDTVASGGAAAQLEDVSERKVYTWLGDSAAKNVDLNGSAANRFSETNTGITSAMLGLDAVAQSEREAYRTKLLTWARGVDVDDTDQDEDASDGRRFIGDPMHSRPMIMNYANDQSIVYLATNEGFLHAIETDQGTEEFAFMPKHLLGNIDDFYVNTASVKHPYGLDGIVSVLRDDDNGNFVIDGNDTAMLFLGMRRGGRNYYGFDVSSYDDPKLAWTIEGGVAGDDFEELGESWSRATTAKMRFGTTIKDVLIIGGGYDSDSQDPNYASTDRNQPADTRGRALFIVDAKTGEKLWSVGHPDATGVDTTFADMTHALPSDVRIVDVDLDGLVDQLYTADMGGQIWRFDVIKNPTAGADLLEGGVIAKLNGTADSDHRRFYNEPDVALIEKDGSRFMAISIGSGWRAHPLDKIVEDRFYVIKSPHVRSQPGTDKYGIEKDDGTGFRPIVESDLEDVANAEGIPPSNPNGWFFDFSTTGEKVLGKSVTFDNSVIFTTYVPDAASATQVCAPSIGGGRAYILSAVNGYPTRDLSSLDNSDDYSNPDQADGKLDIKDRSINLIHGGIAPEPAILITEQGEPLLLVGPEKIGAGFSNPTKRTFWADRGKADVKGRQTVTVEADETD